MTELESLRSSIVTMAKLVRDSDQRAEDWRKKHDIDVKELNRLIDRLLDVLNEAQGSHGDWLTFVAFSADHELYDNLMGRPR